MSNLKLVPDDPTPLEKMLLDASRAELPSDEHKAKLRAALGIGMPLSAPFSSPPASSTAPVQHAPASASIAPAPVAGAVGKTSAAAKVALGLAALALVGAFALTRQPSSAPAPAKPVTPAQVVVAPAPAPVVAKEALPEVSPLPPVEPGPAAAPRAARSDSSALAADDLSEQIRLIEAARAGVAGHDAKAALSALDSYSAKFPRGSFGQEALVLRIRAVDQSGDTARATAMAKSFLARFPNSPHVARLKPIAERGASR